ncbi:MAG: dethiobiotin synthase [Chitinophagales bacterium]
MKKYVIAGIGTDIGKTVASAVLVEALAADYWKPVQSGNVDNTDSHFIEKYARNHNIIHREAFLLNEPVSPHLAAKLESKVIDIELIELINTNNHLIIETAGGLLSPLSEKYLCIDLIKRLQLPVILISMNYLGSINHTLLSIEALKQRNIPIEGIIFSGEPNPETERYILEYSKIPLAGKIPFADNLTSNFISEQAKQFKHLLD